jgi:hypothetical protein
MSLSLLSKARVSNVSVQRRKQEALLEALFQNCDMQGSF